MGPLEWVVFGLGVPLGTLLLLRLVAATGGRLSDDPKEAPERKLQARAVPAVGGTALFLVGLVYFFLADQLDVSSGDRGTMLLRSGPVAGALAGAFLVGLFDDLREGGLAAGPKVLLQFTAALPLFAIAPGPEGVALVFAGVVAMNARLVICRETSRTMPP